MLSLPFIFAVLVMVVILIITVELLIPRAIIALGNVDSWWSPFRTLPPPGEMYILVRGDPDGPFDTVIESVVGYRYNEKTHHFEPSRGRAVPAEQREDEYLRNIGLVWVGFWRYFLWRKVRYDKWEAIVDPRTGQPTGQSGLVPKIRGDRDDPKDSPSIFFRYNMATRIEGAETVGNFPVNAIVVFTVQIYDPVQAFFFAGGWEAQTNAAVQAVFREYVGSKDIDQLRQEQAAGANALVQRIKSLSYGMGWNWQSGLRNLFGVEIVDARFVKFDLAGDEEMAQATRTVQIETLKAQAAAVRGDGERQERENRAKGIIAEVAAYGSHPVGKAVAMSEAIKEAKPKVLGGGVFSSVDLSEEK